jgi:hypothetical protein
MLFVFRPFCSVYEFTTSNYWTYGFKDEITKSFLENLSHGVWVRFHKTSLNSTLSISSKGSLFTERNRKKCEAKARKVGRMERKNLCLRGSRARMLKRRQKKAIEREGLKRSRARWFGVDGHLCGKKVKL